MPQRILYLIETLAHGGAEHQLVRTVQSLDRTLFEPIVCFFRAPDFLASSLTDSGIQVVPLNLASGRQHWPELAWRLKSLARDVRADLIHTSLLEADVVGGVAGKLAGVPVISTLCNIAGEAVRLTDNPRNSWLKFKGTNLLWGSALRTFHRHSIAISNAVRDSAVSTFHMAADRITVIYRGIEPTRPALFTDSSEAKRSVGFESASPLLLSIGRLAPQKGQKYLIAALPEVARHFPKTRLLIVGEGWLRPTLEAQAAALGVSEHVEFLGKRTDIPDLLAACDVFVFPSLFEGLGVSLLEASYAGCACVSSNAGPLPEIVQDGKTGLLVPPTDSRALAQALLRLAREPAYARRLGDAAREQVLQRFMLTEKVKELEGLYARLLSKPAAIRS